MIKKFVFDFCTQVLVVFAYVVILLNIFCIIFGNDAKEISSIFVLGKSGLSVNTFFQFLLASVLMVGIRTLFASDFVINKLPYILRNILMLLLIFAVIVAFVVIFAWFPVGQAGAWIKFAICYGVSVVLSSIVTALKIKIENKRLENALEQLKSMEEKDERE